MRFKRNFHTKPLLMTNPSVLLDLCRTSSAFANSDLAKDLEILKTVCDPMFSMTAAHILVQNFSIPIELLRANNFELLKVRDQFDETVAHRIAKFSNALWELNIEKHNDLLLLKRHCGTTVAHNLAYAHPEIFQQRIGPNIDLLTVSSDGGYTVGHRFLFNCKNIEINPEMLMNKHLLIKNIEGFTSVIFAESVVDHAGEKLNIGLKEMALHMITLGAAYKHSTLYDYKIGEYLLENTKNLISDSLDGKISFKYAMALYSTISHNIDNLTSSFKRLPQESIRIELEKNKILLNQAGQIICDLLSENSFDASALATDYYCEPAEIYLKKIISEKNLTLGALSELEQLVDFDNRPNSDISTKTIY